MNKTERVEMPEDSVDTVGLDRRLQEKSVSDSLKIGLVDDGDCLQKQLLAIQPPRTPALRIRGSSTGVRSDCAAGCRAP